MVGDIVRHSATDPGRMRTRAPESRPDDRSGQGAGEAEAESSW